MKFEEARQELETLSDGSFYAMQYDFTAHTAYDDGRESEAECAVYLNHYKWHRAKTWRQALDLLRIEMEKKEIKQPIKEEMPDEENDITEAV